MQKCSYMLHLLDTNADTRDIVWDPSIRIYLIIIKMNIHDYTIPIIEMNMYRFYHCYQTPFSIVCHRVDNENILPSEPNSRLLFVPKYLPEVLDTLVLNYKYYQNVKIVKVKT